MSRSHETRTYREQVEAGTPSADKTAQRALRNGRAARCDVCGRIVSWRCRVYTGVTPEPVLSTHTKRLGRGFGNPEDECPGSGLPVVVDPHVRPLT